MIKKYLAWNCKRCNYWQSREIRLVNSSEFIPKLKKTTLNCIRCKSHTKIKSENVFGLNVQANFYDDPLQCMNFIKQNNLPKNHILRNYL